MKSSAPKIKNFKTVIHIALAKFHLLKEAGTIVWPRNEINGKTVICETNTPKNKYGDFGKPKKLWYINEKGSPEFKTLSGFHRHYKSKT